MEGKQMGGKGREDGRRKGRKSKGEEKGRGREDGKGQGKERSGKGKGDWRERKEGKRRDIPENRRKPRFLPNVLTLGALVPASVAIEAKFGK